MDFNGATLKKALIKIWPAIFLALVTFGVFFTTLVVKNHTFYAGPDNIDQFYAWYQKLAYAVHQGILPIWDANVSAGHTFVGELQAGVFYPVNLIWVWLFGSSHGISVYWLELIVIFHFWLASVGMYLAGRSIGLRKASALAAGMAYAFGGGVAVRSVAQTAIFFGLAYIPWVFFWFQRWQQTQRKWYLVGCSVSLGFIILAGHVDPWYFASLILLFSIIFRPATPSFEPWLKSTDKRIGVLAIVMLGSLIVALPQVVFSAQYLPQAERFVGDPLPIGPGQKVSLTTFTKTYSFKPQDFLSLLDPVQYPVTDGNEIYVGLTGLAVILTAVFLFREKLRANAIWRARRGFMFGATAIAGVIMLGYWTFIPAVMRELPLFTQVRQLARYSIVFQFCAALLVGICIEVVATNYKDLFKGKKKIVIGVAAMLLAIGFLALNTVYIYLVSQRSTSLDKHLAYQSGILTLALIGCLLLRKKIMYVLLGAMVLSSIAQPLWFMPQIRDVESTYPPNYYKLTPAITYLEKYYGQDRVLIVDKALPINIGDVYNIQTIGGYGATLHQNFYQFLNEPESASQKGLHPDLLNVRFVVAKTPQIGLKKVFTDNQRGISIYERPQYLPRAYFADQLNACDYHTIGCTPINITAYSDADIKLHYQSTNPERLVLSEVNYTGWRAYVDGVRTQITAYSPTNVKLFRSIQVPAGSHNIEFRYQPFGL